MTPTTAASAPQAPKSALEPRVAVLLGVSRTWYLPLLFARASSTAPAAYWSSRCAWTLFWAFMDGIYDAAPAEAWEFEHARLLMELMLALIWVSDWRIQSVVSFADALIECLIRVPIVFLH